jgi:hypothetical protein
VASLGIDFKNQEIYVLAARTGVQTPQSTAGILGAPMMKK